jgi:hypothetical protein
MFPLAAPLAIGGAAAVPRVLGAVPTPGEFVGALRDVVGRVVGSGQGHASPVNSHDAQKQEQLRRLTASESSALSTPNAVDALRQKSQDALASLHRLLAELFSAGGVDWSRDVRLSPDDRGRVTVTGDHPDAAKIEQLIAQSPQAQTKMAAAVTSLAVLHAAEQSPEFRQDYARDPLAAVARHAHLLDDAARPKTTLVVGRGAIDVKVE